MQLRLFFNTGAMPTARQQSAAETHRGAYGAGRRVGRGRVCAVRRRAEARPPPAHLLLARGGATQAAVPH